MGPVEKMNFAKWLLLRIKRTLIGDGQWRWLLDYRSLILRNKLESVLVTFFAGLCWFVMMGVFSLLLLPTKEAIVTTMQFTLASIPAFYIYNWLVALYEIYDAERMATWDRLKEAE